MAKTLPESFTSTYPSLSSEGMVHILSSNSQVELSKLSNLDSLVNLQSWAVNKTDRKSEKWQIF